ncbi:MAG: methyltransferase domain-containing protein [Ferruginibacter sp.]
MSNKNFVYKEFDQEGLDVLNVISAADRFNNWMYQSIKPFLKGDILEIGSGIGNITQFVIDDKFKVTASDIRDNYCSILHHRFDDDPYLQEVRNIDIIHPGFDREYHDLLDKFDSIFALNIVEHVENDELAIQNCKKLLRKNGNLVILVPAYQALYNGFDKELEHFRRYTKSKLENLFLTAGLKIYKTQYFNFIGIAGWWFSGSILRNKTIPGGQMKLYNKLVPVFKLVDKIIMNKIGLSVITFGTKK